jgi:hypothetical protein
LTIPVLASFFAVIRPGVYSGGMDFLALAQQLEAGAEDEADVGRKVGRLKI